MEPYSQVQLASVIGGKRRAKGTVFIPPSFQVGDFPSFGGNRRRDGEWVPNIHNKESADLETAMVAAVSKGDC
jgi:hypothetical protein